MGRRWTCAAVAMVLILGLASVAHAIDSDGDGVDDVFDNCVTYANPLQRDSDGDGFGNRCDVDFDQSGQADGRDVRHFTRMLRQGDPGADIDENGVVDAHDAIAAVPLWGKPPGPGAAVQDTDGDGVPAAADACQDSIGDGPVLADGCNAVDLVTQVERRSIDPVAMLLSNPFAGLEVPALFDGALADLGAALATLRDAGRQAARGEPCAAVGTGLVAVRLFEDAQTEFQTAFLLFRARQDALFPSTGDEPEEPAALDDAMQPARFARSYVTRGVELARGAVADIEALCLAAVGPDQVSGTVRGIDLERRAVTLESGEELGLAADFVREATPQGDWEMIPGSRIEVDLLRFSGGGGLVRTARLLEVLGDISLPSLACGAVRIAPFQLSPTITAQPRIFHRPDGYTLDGKLQLEQHMRIGVFTETCPQPDPPFVSLYGAAIMFDLPGQFAETQAEFLKQGESVPVPAFFDDPLDFQITVVIKKRDCNAELCGPVQTVDSQTYDARLQKLHHYCQAELSDTGFEVEKSGGFGVTQVLRTHTVRPPALPGDLFSALGFRVVDGQYEGTVSEIGVGEPFAIFATDPRDLHRAAGLSDAQIDRLVGTSRASGLVWPRIKGGSAAAPHWYSCAPERIARDSLSQCLDNPDALPTFYEYPFSSAVTGQPPFGTASHGGVYAWDIGAPVGTPIFAARGGKVVLVEESNSMNCPDGGCEGNLLVIQHQDGTVANYRHLDMGGVLVGLHDHVERGQVVALSGNTGRSQGPHLHWGHEFPGESLSSQADDVPVAAKFHVLKKVDGVFQEVYCDQLLIPGVEVQYIAD